MMKNLLLSMIVTIPLIHGCSSDDDNNDNKSTTPNILNGQSYKVTCNASADTTYQFTSNTTGNKIVQAYDTPCLVPTGPATKTAFTYSLGASLPLDNQGQAAGKIDITETGSATLYTIQGLTDGLLGTDNMTLGSTGFSSAGLDGTTDAKRHDGLDLTVIYTLQP